MVEVAVPFIIKSSDPTVIKEIDARLEKIGICKDSFFGDYKTYGNAVSSDEKYNLGMKIKSDILSIIQSVANDKNAELVVEQMAVSVDFGLNQVAPNYTGRIKERQIAIFVANIASSIYLCA